MKRNEFLEATGFRHIANHGSKEIHRVQALTGHCNIQYIADGGYCTGLWAWWLGKRCGYDGCYFCNRKYHTK